MRRSLFFLFILTTSLTGCPRQQPAPPQAGKGQPFLDAKQDVPPGLEWSRDVIAKNPGTFKVRVVSQGPIVVMAMSARVWQATQANKLRPADKSEVYLNADVKETTFEREITVPAGSTYIMIKNNSDKQTTIHLQVFDK
jgi:hypothetical protein